MSVAATEQALPSWLLTYEIPSDEVDRLREIHQEKFREKVYPCVTCGAKRDDPEPHTYLSPKGVVECDCRAQWKLHRYLTYCGLGDKYMRYSWADVTAIDLATIGAVNDYAVHYRNYAKRGLGLLLFSPRTGTGKTMLASLLFKQLLQDRVDGFFLDYRMMLDYYADGWRDSGARRWFDRRVRNAGVLVLDDVGREPSTEAMLEMAGGALESILRARIYHNRPTIITTNLTPGQLRNRYSQQIDSLLDESFIEQEVYTSVDSRARVKEREQDYAKRGIDRPVTFG